MPIVGRGERGDRIHQKQRRMAGGVDRLADFADRRQAAGRGFAVQDAHRLDLVRLVLAQMLFDQLGIGADAPVGLDEFGLQAEPLGHHLPERRELAGLDHEHAIARRQRVGQRCFPGAGAGRGVDDHRLRGLEDGLDALQHALGHLGEFRPALVDQRHVDGAQHAVGNGRRSGNSRKWRPEDATFAACRHSFGWSFREIVEIGRLNIQNGRSANRLGPKAAWRRFDPRMRHAVKSPHRRGPAARAADVQDLAIYHAG